MSTVGLRKSRRCTPLFFGKKEVCLAFKLDSRPSENANSCRESGELIYDRGDCKSIDIVARRKTRGERKRQPRTRRLSSTKRPRKTISYGRTKRGTARLRCAEGAFRVHKIYGDGNCLFRAVSYILWGNEDEHRALRARVTHHIKSHWREYGPFVTAEWSITSPEAYYNFMISEGVFATELEGTVATRLYGMNLSIYREIDGSDGQVKRVFHNRVGGSYETARLLFSGRSDSGHYDVLFVDS